MMDWSFDEHYGSRERVVMAFADQLRKEVEVLEEAGAEWIQIDEPAISVRPEEISLAVKAMKIMTEGVKARTSSHICYGSFDAIYPALLELPVDQLDLELANRDFDLLEHFKRSPYTKEIGLGVIDVHSHEIDDPEKVEAGIRAALEIISVEKIFVDPDCGLKTRTTEEAREKLRVMVEATRKVRRSLEAKVR
jgi:5-methyltetrahydropteroyltriglutamate--homocysteine methyltransferase